MMDFSAIMHRHIFTFSMIVAVVALPNVVGQTNKLATTTNNSSSSSTTPNQSHFIKQQQEVDGLHNDSAVNWGQQKGEGRLPGRLQIFQYLKKKHGEDGNGAAADDNYDDAHKQPKQSDVVEAIKHGFHSMKHLYEEKEPQLYAMGLFLTKDNPAHFVATFNQQTEEYRELAKTAYASLEATKQFRKKFPSLTRQALRDTVLNALDEQQQRCPRRASPLCTAASRKYRTSDGSCNNLKEPWWGSAMSTMQRFLPAVYEDGIESIRKSVTGLELPSARQVSDVIHKERDVPLGSITHMLMQWGQFIDHDVTATGQSRAFNGSVPQCCLRNGRGMQPPRFTHPDCLPISVPREDSRLGELGVRCLEFVRSGPAPAADDSACEFGPREQLDQVTSFIDASTIYSSSAQISDSIRIFRNGLLQYGKLQRRRRRRQSNFHADDDVCLQGSLSTGCFRAGDGRLSEQPALISLHVVFLRLHNQLASRLSTINRHWTDEKTFQESRKIVGALVQHITYHEFLPIVLGQKVVKAFDLELVRTGYYNGYDASVNPNIANAFASAAYRFGHSLVQPSFVRFDRKHRPLLNNVSIHEEFAHPINLETAGSVDRILLGLVNQPAQKRDEFISEELTNHLFQTRGFSFGMDLAALNIQRGRDHGIAPFVQWRRACALSPVRDWTDLERIVASGAETVAKFKTLYAAVEDIDLFSAGLAEKPVRDGLVGPTFACIIAQQFRNLRRGDRFWYENAFPDSSGFNLAQLAEIRRSTLAQILCSTLSDSGGGDNRGIDDIQPFVMLSVDELRNQRLSCRDHPSLSFMNLDAWLENEQPAVVAAAAAATAAAPTVSPADASLTRTPKAQQTRRPEKPNKTRINQHNRVTVNAGRRPALGSSAPHNDDNNLTIVINNNAVFSPVYIKDSLYGSHQYVLDHFMPGSNAAAAAAVTPALPVVKPPSMPVFQFPYAGAGTTTATAATADSPRRTIGNHEASSNQDKVYYPHNFGDQYSPDSPRYSLNGGRGVSSEWLSKLLLADNKHNATTTTTTTTTTQRDDNPDSSKSSAAARLHHENHTVDDDQDWDFEMPKPLDEIRHRRR